MDRPSTAYSGKILRWTILVKGEDGRPLDADSDPTVTLRKAGAAATESVTVTKRAGATGLYDCTVTPAGSLGDPYEVTESVEVYGNTTPYVETWTFTLVGALGSSETTVTDFADDLTDIMNAPKVTKTEEGTVVERSVEELIKADAYLQNKASADNVPWGIRVARIQPGDTLGRS
jgi:hypothetical protein